VSGSIAAIGNYFSWWFPEFQKIGGIMALTSNGIGGTELGGRARAMRVQTMPVLDFDSTKSNAAKMLTQ